MWSYGSLIVGNDGTPTLVGNSTTTPTVVGVNI